MAEDSPAFRQQGVVNGCSLSVGLVAATGSYATGSETLLTLGAFGVLLGTSTAVVTFSLLRFTGLPLTSNDGSGGSRNHGQIRRAWRVFTGRALEGSDEEDTGWLIGRLENLLVFSLVLVGQYTALSIIFAAKSWVRHEDTGSEDSTYYLAGTLVNFTYSIAIGLLTVHALG